MNAANIKIETRIETKKQAKVSKSTPAQLFSESILKELSKDKSIKKTIQNQRTRSLPKVPT